MLFWGMLLFHSELILPALHPLSPAPQTSHLPPPTHSHTYLSLCLATFFTFQNQLELPGPRANRKSLGPRLPSSPTTRSFGWSVFSPQGLGSVDACRVDVRKTQHPGELGRGHSLGRSANWAVSNWHQSSDCALSQSFWNSQTPASRCAHLTSPGPTCSLCRQSGALGSADRRSRAWEGGAPRSWAQGCVLVTLQQSLTPPSGRLPAWTSGRRWKLPEVQSPFGFHVCKPSWSCPSWAEQTAWRCVTHL